MECSNVLLCAGYITGHFIYRLQHCLEWVMRVYTSKLTPDSVVTYLFHDWTQPIWMWLFCLLWHVRTLVCDDQSAVHLNWHLRMWPMFEGLKSCASYFDLVFVLLCWISRRESSGYTFAHSLYCAIWRVVAHFCGEYSRARPSTTRSGQVSDSECVSQFSCRTCLLGRSAVRTKPRLLQQLLCLCVACCALVRNSLQTRCMQWVMTR